MVNQKCTSTSYTDRRIHYLFSHKHSAKLLIVSSIARNRNLKLTLNVFTAKAQIYIKITRNVRLFRGRNNARSSGITERIYYLIGNKFSQFQALSGHLGRKN